MRLTFSFIVPGGFASSLASFASALASFYHTGLLLLSTCTFFQPQFAAHQTEPVNLSAVISSLSQKYSRLTGLAADFTQIYIAPDGRSRRESGRLLLKKTRKARWDYEAPERKVFLSDGRNIYFYVYGDPEATSVSIRESADPQIPFLFLLGHSDLRKEFARIELAPTEEPLIRGNLVLRLFPKRAPEEFKQILVEVSTASLTVHRVVIVAPDNSRMDFHLANVREGYVPPDSDFTFAPPPGVKIRRAN
ncbi:MAG TPA: outer membrane lipoprotein carrier protein LolA [Blastocatellia bacterium]|nr:outer membrane lipoprotein carrier protein LolA [Blastocatellia bacterium]